ncbi:MAG: ABC transporter ATP-binding protein [Clostridia bacterium]|nr:ABC transporter ATP-binding protein [Clostridia bacterium]
MTENKALKREGGTNVKNKNKGTMSEILRYVGKYWYYLLLTVLLSAVTVGLTLYVPVLIGDGIDFIVKAGQVDFQALFSVLIQIGVCVGGTFLTQWAASLCNNKITYHVVRDVRAKAIRKIQALPLKYIDQRPYGEIVNNVISDVEQFADGLLMGFTQLFTGVLTILGTLAFMFFLHWQLALIVLLVTPLSLFTAKFISEKTYSMFREQSATRGEQTAFIDEMLGALPTVQAYAHEDENLKTFDEINERLEKCSLKAIFFSSLTNPTTRFVNAVVYALIALFGAFTVIASAGGVNPFTVGALSKFLSYSNQYTKPFNEITGVVTEFQNALACASRVFALLDEAEEVSDVGAEELIGVDGDVSLKNVSFSYVPERKLIENLNLEVVKGKRVAIVGPTGCGKTTVINLLMRFYDVCGGEILVEGQDIRSVTRHSLRSHYGMVLQETWLKSGTIGENLRMGLPDATDEQMLSAAKAAHAHGFISRLPEGYNTYIGEDGGSLSQGQKQLLCIARIMLLLPPMLILDEATSSIDTRTELKIQEAFATLMRGRTSFIVAHRLSTIKTADVILVMNNGNIVEQGTHTELLKKNGFYAKLYNSQFA